MSPNETPPSSPSIYPNLNEDDEPHPLNANDMVEIVEDNLAGVIDSGDEVDSDDSDPFPGRDDALTVFSEHEDGVLSCDFHPKASNIVVTGGIDDTAYVWDANTGNKIFTCKGHEESVEIVSFSYDGSYLATGDLNGTIQVWRTKDFKPIAKYELDDELSWIEWHAATNVLVAAAMSGLVYMYKLPSGEMKMLLSPFGQNCLAGKILPDGKSLVSGYKDGSLKIVDLKQATIIREVKSFEELGGVTCLDVHKKNNLIICGYDTGAVVLVNSANGKMVSILQGSQHAEGCGYMEAVSFCKDPTYDVAASGSLDGCLIVWDIIRQTLRHKYNFATCINHLSWHPSLPLLFTCHFEGVARVYDAKAGVIVKEYMGHERSCLNMALSNDGSFLVTTSEDNTARIFTVSNIM